MYLIIGLILVGAGTLLGALYAREKYLWNQGYCRKCGEEWIAIHSNIDGHRVYECKNKHVIWISYKSIDVE